MADIAQREVEVKDLLLDPDNPRFFELRELKGRSGLLQEALMKEISEDREIQTLLKSIKRSGVMDPIWVKPVEKGKYLVIEGNRRTFILKKLIEEKVTPPPGISYEHVLANIVPSDTSDRDLLIRRAQLQAGKKVWGPFNEAVATYELRTKYHQEEEDIAVDLQISVAKVRERIANYLLFLEYVKQSRNSDPRRFAFFTDAPKPVKEWIEESVENKKRYFELITPANGVQRIRSVATKGGLRDFAQVVGRPEVVRRFIDDKNMTVEEAVDMLKDIDITVDAKFVKQFRPFASKLAALDETQIAKISKNKRLEQDFKYLLSVCKSVAKKMGIK